MARDHWSRLDHIGTFVLYSGKPDVQQWNKRIFRGNKTNKIIKSFYQK